MSLDSSRGPFSHRGHEYCTDPPPLDKIIVRPEPVEASELECTDVKGLEQGYYVVSMPMAANPTNTPEGRHHIYLQVYEDPKAKSDIAEEQVKVGLLELALKEDNHSANERRRLEVRLAIAKENASKSPNRALLLEVYGKTPKLKGTMKISISSPEHGQACTRPDLNDPYTVISPILTKSDLEKAGVTWVDPDLRKLNESVARMRKEPYFLLGKNCKYAVLEWIKSGIDSMGSLPPGLQKIAQANINKPINANTSFGEIFKNTFIRRAKAVGRCFKRLTGFGDTVPKFAVGNGVKLSVKSEPSVKNGTEKQKLEQDIS